jgi:rod shape-determining protein MreD
VTAQVILVGLAGVMALLQTTWFSDLAIFGARPDMVLIVLTFSAHRYGVRPGEIGGFLVGLLEDGLSASPLGFNGLVRTVHSAVLGLTSGMVHSESVITPAILVLMASLIRWATVAFVALVFRFEAVLGKVFTAATAMEILLTTVLAVPSFLALHFVIKRVQGDRRVL